MMKLIVFATLFVAALAEKPYLGFNLPLFSPRIVGGSDAKRGEFPHQVSLQWGPSKSGVQHFCGGLILNKDWILTAGHCILAVPSFGSFVVKAGKHNIRKLETTEQTVEVMKTVVHKSYKGGVAPYDIAMIRLRSSLRLNDNVKNISLPKSNSVPKGNVTLSGWGSVSSTSVAKMPEILQTVNLPIVALNQCKQALEGLIGPSPLHSTNVCTGPLTGGYSACSGDSGGPLIQNSTVVGIVSWGIIPCGTYGAPSVYTRVSAFIDWIHETMNNNI